MHYAFVFATFTRKMLFVGPPYDNKVASQNQVINIYSNPQGVLIQDIKKNIYIYISVKYMTEQGSQNFHLSFIYYVKDLLCQMSS